VPQLNSCRFGKLFGYVDYNDLINISPEQRMMSAPKVNF